jgi:hypothetical protein
MKTLSGLTKCGLVVILAFCLVSFQCDRKHNVIFLPNLETADQIVLPGTEISAEDAGALKRTLEASDENFYIIQPWEDGVPGKPFGKLPYPKCLEAHGFHPPDEGAKTGISRTNFSRWSRVIGQGCQTRCVSGINDRGHRHKRTAQGSQDLVNAVKPVLQKYQKK